MLTFPCSRRLSSLILVPVLVVVLAGCGGDDDSDNGGGTDTEQITSVAQNFVGDIHDQKWKDVCSAFSQAALAQVAVLVQTIKAPGCPEAIKVALTQPGNNTLEKVDADAVKVTKVKIVGDKATAVVTPSADKDPTTYFVKEGKAWKIDADPSTRGTVTTK